MFKDLPKKNVGESKLTEIARHDDEMVDNNDELKSDPNKEELLEIMQHQAYLEEQQRQQRYLQAELMNQ